MSIQTLHPQDLIELRKRIPSLRLVDVRTPAEYEEIHADCAVNFPLEDFDAKEVMEKAWLAEGESVYVICRSGSRGAQACKKLVAAGYENVVNIEGGTLAWSEAGLPVIRGKKTMSLERQVRIAAGVFVLTGVILAVSVHPYFVGLSAFVGAGLVFAGITDTCGMGMLLAKMPWNRKSRENGTGITCSAR